jgi:hypothetical protein
MPRGFYHNNIKFEDAYRDQQQQLRHLMTRALNDSYPVFHDKPWFLIEEMQMQVTPQSIVVHSIGIEDRYINLEVTLTIFTSVFDAARDPKIQEEAFAYECVVRFVLQEPVGLRSGDDGSKWWLYYAFLPSSFSDSLEMQIVKRYFDLGYVGGRTRTMIPLSETARERLQNFVDLQRGLPYEASGDYLRMLYLSAVTITTLGYGDIVPITTAARLTVALEAVIGIVLAGLFINFAIKDRGRA